MRPAVVVAGLAVTAYQVASLALRWRGTAAAAPGLERRLARGALLLVRGGGIAIGLAVIAWGAAG